MAPDGDPRPYHHGDLATALLDSAEAELVERGLAAFSLRATAKRAGVSHAAPAHHFGSARGMLKALTARGFTLLAEEMEARVATAGTPSDRLTEAGLGYTSFADRRPALFELMFGGLMAEEVGEAAGNGAFGVLVRLVDDLDPTRAATDWNAVAAAWGLVHGLAQLLAAGRMTFLDDLAEDRETALRAVLERGLPRLAGRG